MKKRFLSAFLATAMLATTLTGCGESEDKTTEATTEKATTEAATDAGSDAGSDDGAADYEECTIKFDWWGGDSRHEATQAAVDAFEAKYPGITVEINFGAWSDWETAKANEYLSGNNPDVQQTNFDWIGKYDADGTTYLDLNTVSDVLDLSQYDQAVLDKCVDVNGGLAGIPVSVTGRTFYWNEATFEKAGLSTPTNLDELMAAGPVFKEKLGDNYYPLVIGEYDRAILVAFYLQAKTGQPIINEKNEVTVTEADFKEGLEFIKSLEDAHVIPTVPYIDGEGADSMDKSQRFINGEYAGIFEWDSSPAKYVSALGDNGDDLVVGNVFPELQSYSKVSLMFSISADTEHPRECAMLLNYLLNDPEGAAIMANERGIPESASAYATLEAAGTINPLSAQAHTEVINSDPLYWNPLFDSKVLKGDTSVYTTVFEQYSYGMDASGSAYDVDKAAADLYKGYQDAVAQ
ncbi:MAG: carbohydrate ABC transporter substrate-binding protein [Lachnospiraceae bacterium]|nr:carbohydrate ABC transporter substrate-binding protein [Lachnospiraceae bacterium]